MSWINENISWLGSIIAGIFGIVLGHFLQERGKIKTSKTKEINKLKSEVKKLQSELDEIKSLNAFRATLKYVETGFYSRVDNAGLDGDHYCSKCLDNDDKKIRINILENGNYICPACHNEGLFSVAMRDDYNQKLQRINDDDQQTHSFQSFCN